MGAGISAHAAARTQAYGAGVKPSTALLLPVALLALNSCRRDTRAETDLSSRVLFTASGSFDAQADRRERIGGGRRQVSWTTRPPLDAAAVSVQFNGEARAQSWVLDITGPKFTARTLAGPQARTVDTPLGQGLRPVRASRLNDTLILSTPEGLRILTRGYVTQRQPELLGAFRAP